MPIKQKKKRISSKKMQRGTVGNFFVFGILTMLAVLGIVAVGGLPSDTFPHSGQVVNIITPTPDANHDTLQLKWMGYVTIAPTPTPGASSLCKQGGINNEPEILAGYSPGPGQSVGTTGQVKVWASDEGAPFIAPGQVVNLQTGAVSPGTGQLTAKAPDGYLWEPALYISPQTAESGGTPHFPNIIKGQFSNTPPTLGNVIQGATPDSIPAGQPTAAYSGGWFGNGLNQYTAEYIWNVSSLGLTTGTYQAEFVIHDGDRDRGVGCATITIQ